MDALPKIEVRLKSGNEELVINDHAINLKLIDFWRWNLSDLVGNTSRGHFAEFIVASALGIDLNTPREEWAAYDLVSPDGIKIEVKSAAYIQAWKQKKHSPISFSIRETSAWDFDNNQYIKNKTRQADVYVFCLLHHKDQLTLNPLDLNQWEFYVCPVDLLNKNATGKKTIGLNTLKKWCSAVPYDLINSIILSTIK